MEQSAPIPIEPFALAPAGMLAGHAIGELDVWDDIALRRQTRGARTVEDLSKALSNVDSRALTTAKANRIAGGTMLGLLAATLIGGKAYADRLKSYAREKRRQDALNRRKD